MENSEVAAKRDDAKVPIQFWDKRITLIWPHLSLVIPKLRKWLLNKLCRNLFLEFKAYMFKTYGTTWESVLLTLTQNRSLIGILGSLRRETLSQH